MELPELLEDSLSRSTSSADDVVVIGKRVAREVEVIQLPSKKLKGRLGQPIDAPNFTVKKTKDSQNTQPKVSFRRITRLVSECRDGLIAVNAQLVIMGLIYFEKEENNENKGLKRGSRTDNSDLDVVMTGEF